jgi:hypothetical protein
MSTAMAVSLAMGQESLLCEDDELPEEGEADAVPSGGPQRKPRNLDELIVDTWEGLVRGTSQCPVCGGRLEPQFGAHARPVGGHCADCGSTIR